jgi:SAM-dependent methyltransferase
MNSGIAYKGYFAKYYNDRVWHFYNYLIEKIIHYSSPGKILDIGSGSGLFLEACYNWGWDAIGIEGSQEAISTMQSRNKNLKAISHYISSPFPFEDSIFQTVLINQVIEHLESEVQMHCLKEAYRVLKPGGVIIIESPSRFNKKEWKADPTHINLLSPSELKNLLIKSGFVKIVENNSALNILGSNKIMIKIIQKIFVKTKFEYLSSTANTVSYKSE